MISGSDVSHTGSGGVRPVGYVGPTIEVRITPGLGFQDTRRFDLDIVHEGVVVIKIGITHHAKGNVNVLIQVFTAIVIRPSSGLLEGLPINMTSDEIRTLPVIGKAQAVETIIGQARRDFLKIIVLLLAGVEVFIIDVLEHAQPLQLGQSLAEKYTPLSSDEM